MNEIIDEQQRMLENGFSLQEADEFAQSESIRMRKSGFSEEEVNAAFGIMPFDEEGFSNQFEKNVTEALQGEDLSQFNTNVDKTSGQPMENMGIAGVPKFQPTGFDPILHAGDPNYPRPAITFMDYLAAGLQGSLYGLESRGKLPDIYIPENATFLEGFTANAATVAGDLPGFITGGAAGAAIGAKIGAPLGPPGAAAGASIGAGALGFLAVESLKELYIQNLTKGSVTDWQDFWERAGAVAYKGFKGSVVGGAVGAVGFGAPRFFGRTTSQFGPVKPLIQSPVGNFAATTAAEVATLVTVGNALEGQFPSVDQFGGAAALIFGLKSLGKGGRVTLSQMRKSPAFRKVADIWKVYGVDPDILARDARQYADVFTDLNSGNRAGPRAYEPPNSRTDPGATKEVNLLVDAMRSQKTFESNVIRSVRGETPFAPKLDEKGNPLVEKGDPLFEAQESLRTELKKQGLSQEAIDTQIAEFTQEASDTIADHTITRVEKSTKEGDVGAVSDAIRAQKLLNPVDRNMVEDAVAPIRKRLEARGFPKEEIESRVDAIKAEAINDINEAESKVLGGIGVDPQKLRIPATVKTGEPFQQTLIRGQGRQDSAMNPLAPEGGVFGEGRYTTDNLEYARYFGPNLTKHIVNLKNPFVISSDAQWRELTKKAGWEFPNQVGLDPAQQVKEVSAMRAMLEKAGHDGIIIRVPKSEAEGKTMQRVFGENQVIEFNEKKPTSGAKPPPEPPLQEGDMGGAKDRILSKVSIGDHGPRGGGPTWEQFFMSVFDDIIPFENDLKAMGQSSVPTADNMYRAGRLYRGVMAKAGEMIDYGPVDFHTFKRTGRGLTQILKDVGKDLDGFRTYLLAKDSIDSAAKGVDTGLDLQASRMFAGDKNNIRKYEELSKEIVHFQNMLAKYLMQSGVIAKADYNFIVKANPNHVPMFRLVDEGNFIGVTSKGTIKNPLKKRVGGDSTIIDPLESIIKNAYAFVMLADRNYVGRLYLERANDSGVPEQYYKKLKPNVKGIAVSEKEMQKFLKENGIEEAPAGMMTVFRAATAPTRSNEMVVYKDGKRSVYEVRPETADAFKNLDRPATELWLRIASLPAKTLRAGIVISPEFIARNFSRDIVFAFGMNKDGYIPLLDTMRGLMSIIKKDKDFHNFLLSGGANSSIVAIDRLYIEGKIGKLNDQTGIGRSAINLIKSPLQALQAISEVVENMNRVGVFKKSQEAESKREAKELGIKYDPLADPSKRAILAGGFAGRNDPTDFQRKGANAYALSKLTAFFNPHMQGMLRLGEALKENPVGTSAKFFFAVTLPAILLWLNNRDDPRHEGTPQWVKDQYFIIYTDDVTYRIAKSHEAGFLYASLVERTLDSFFKDNDKAFNHFRESLFNILIPSLMPTIAVPIFEQYANKSIFTGRPIIPRSQENLFPEYQFKPYTSELTKSLAQVFGHVPGLKKAAIEDESAIGFGARALNSPVLIDNYVRAWTGGIGQYVMDLVDATMRKAGLIPNPIRPADTLADVPFVKAFVLRDPDSGNQHIQDFWNGYNKRMKSFATLKMLEKKDDFEAEEKLLQYDPNAEDDLADLAKMMRDHAATIRNLMDIAQEKKYEPGDIPKARDQLRQQIDAAYYNMIKSAKNGLNDMNNMDRTDKEFDKGRGARSVYTGPEKGSMGNIPSKTIPQEGEGSPFPQPGSPLQNEMGAQ